MPAATPRRPRPAGGRRRGRRPGRSGSTARRKVEGRDLFGADGAPGRRARRSGRPHARIHRAAFAFGDLAAYRAAHPGIVAILTAADVPGRNRYGVIPPFADQPVFAEREARFRGEAVAAIVGEAAVDRRARPRRASRSTWTELPAHTDIDERARAEGADRVHADRAGNVLVRGRVARGDVEAGSRRRRTSRSRARSRPASSSMRRSSPRPAGRAASATGSRSRPARRRPTWTATTSPLILGIAPEDGPHRADRGRRRLRHQARPLRAALPGARGLAARPAGPHDLYRGRN